MEKTLTQIVKEKPWVGWALFLGTMVAVFLLGLFGASIMERRCESRLINRMITPIPEGDPRDIAWKDNFPRQFETYTATADTTFASKHGGSATIDYLERDPRLVILWAGYAFSRDYNQGRGHYHAVEDVRKTLRTDVPQPGTCWTCKSTDVPRVMKERGIAAFYRTPWAELGPEIVNNIGCMDCHDPETASLRITRPALGEALSRRGEDIGKVSFQELRSLTCAQCHVEYYFKGKADAYLAFPWDSGFTAERMEAYYDAIGHTDFVHALSRAPMLKAQHPDYELFRTGIHAQRGVSCADCHMVYIDQGGVKFTDHKIRSPLDDISSSCMVCHRQSEETLRENVYERQDKIDALKRVAEDALVHAHIEAKTAWEAGAGEEEMKPVLTLIRHAQWRWDWVAAANSVGFHSPVEAARVLATSIEKAQEARLSLARILAAHGVRGPVPVPDISTKAKAQALVGLDMPALRMKKNLFLARVIPTWDSLAAARYRKTERISP
ncbi:MAG: ammonia-forming cytochrome c nitrite reductase [Bacteroidota bacterium]|nr:ammonia-forming cytochrome c nitrite reductase [Bacteroidota bacterium]